MVPPTPFLEGEVVDSFVFLKKTLVLNKSLTSTLSSVYPRVYNLEDTGPAP